LPDGLDIGRSDTLGMEIVTSLVGQIDGRLEILRDQGTEFRISFREIPYAPRIPE
jgi:two-component sensor histidine kinase